jgi:hypothetical protein
LGGALLFFKNLVSGIFTLFSGLIPSILNLFTGLVATIGSIAGSLLGPAIRTVVGSLSGLFAPLLQILTPLIAVIGTLLLAFKAINFLASKITGKPMDYYEKGKYDPKTTPEDVKKAYGGIGVGEQVISDKQYWNNKKALESDKPIAGFANGKPMQDVRPYLQKQNQAYEKVQEFKNSNDPLQQYRRDVEAGRTKLSFFFTQWCGVNLHVTTVFFVTIFLVAHGILTRDGLIKRRGYPLGCNLREEYHRTPLSTLLNKRFLLGVVLIELAVVYRFNASHYELHDDSNKYQEHYTVEADLYVLHRCKQTNIGVCNWELVYEIHKVV